MPQTQKATKIAAPYDSDPLPSLAANDAAITSGPILASIDLGLPHHPAWDTSLPGESYAGPLRRASDRAALTALEDLAEANPIEWPVIPTAEDLFQAALSDIVAEARSDRLVKKATTLIESHVMEAPVVPARAPLVPQIDPRFDGGQHWQSRCGDTWRILQVMDAFDSMSGRAAIYAVRVKGNRATSTPAFFEADGYRHIERTSLDDLMVLLPSRKSWLSRNRIPMVQAIAVISVLVLVGRFILGV